MEMKEQNTVDERAGKGVALGIRLESVILPQEADGLILAEG